LEHEDEHLGYVIDQVPLPGFLLRPPAVFTVKVAHSPMRVIAFGDFGEPGESETKTADAMIAY